ncbi:glucokinase [Limnobacter sp.]|uniref:glucokinase n=1 Tax=Limnobacter sp. TaxID=2003368 RepID=UPI0035177B19
MAAFALVGDVGGTHARFGLVCQHTGALLHMAVLPVAHFDTLQHALRHYLQSQGLNGVQNACIAVAAPVLGDQVQMINHHWRFSQQALQHELGFSRMLLVNDFKAMAMGMTVIAPDSFCTLQQGNGDPQAPRTVIGPGTGLGTAALVRHGDQWLALPAEGGHVGFAPRDALDVAVWTRLNEQFGRASVERILSGPGLLNLYRAMADIQAQPPVCGDPPSIVEAAKQGDALASAVAHRFCSILGSVAGDQVLALGARGGVYLCGGLLPRLPFAMVQAAFLEGFMAKGRYQGYVADVPVHLCTAPHAALHGAAALLSQAA